MTPANGTAQTTTAPRTGAPSPSPASTMGSDLDEYCCPLTRGPQSYFTIGSVFLPELPPQSRHRREWDQVPQVVVDAVKLLSLGNARWPLVLLGEAGSGKTCAGLCLVDMWGGLYVTAAEWASFVVRCRLGEVETSNGYRIFENEVWRHFALDAPLVVLDELGERNPTDTAYQTVKKAIDVRQGAPLVVISNLTIEQLAKLYSDPVASRLRAGTVVRLEGDRRVGG